MVSEMIHMQSDVHCDTCRIAQFALFPEVNRFEYRDHSAGMSCNWDEMLCGLMPAQISIVGFGEGENAMSELKTFYCNVPGQCPSAGTRNLTRKRAKSAHQ